MLAVWLLPCLLSPLWAATLLKDVQTLEADGKLAEAQAQLERLKVAARQKSSTATEAEKTSIEQHLGFLEGTIELIEASQRYETEGRAQRAIDVLTQYGQRLVEPREAYLALAIQRRIGELHSKLPADAVAQARLARADTLFDRKEYKAAREAYTEVSTMTEAISDDSKSRARRGVANATQKEFEESRVGIRDTVRTKVRESLRDGSATVLEWLLTFVSFLLPVAVILSILPRLLLKKGRSLELLDQGAPSASANRELTQELQDVIDRIRGAGPGSAKLDVTGFGDRVNEDSRELPAPDLAFVTPPVEEPELARQLDALVSATPAVTFGGIGLNPAQLWTLIKRLFTRRTRYGFSGTLTTYDSTLTLRLTREDRLWGRKTEWRSSAPTTSTQARISCLVDIASRIVLDGENASTATSDCYSLKEYILGLYALTADTGDAFKNATPHFQAALDRDAGNWLARFQLALCARGAKDTRTAINHLTWFEGREAAESASLERHKERRPDFPFIVRYQLASTLSLASEDREDLRVGTILDGLVALEDSPEFAQIGDDKRLRLVMLARSGQATREAIRASLAPAADKEAVTRDARRRLAEHLVWFDRNADALQRAAPTGHPLARGIVLHAYGRVRFSSCDKEGAIESLNEAVELLPTYADVRVDLAKAHLEQKGKSDWPRQVDKLLKRALELDPENAKAKFVYARFYFAEETRDYAKAEPYLAAAPFDAASLFMLAQVLHDRGAYAEALSALERAIALKEDGPSFRVRLYADSLRELVKVSKDPTVVSKPNQRVLERRRRQLCKYDNEKMFDARERTQRNYRRIAELYAEICRELGVVQPDGCFPLAPPALPAPAAVPSNAESASA
jgi:tetratricopeptide (TPR) repeat protein